ncbi:MAG TPA: hypothetical protein V6D15_14875 [Oculatellaceae cyanobacterium]|jgi:hypothetical protein
MDSVETQVIALSNKVDAMYQMMDELNYKVSTALSQKVATSVNGVAHSSVAMGRQYNYQHQSSLERTLEHKDILSDGSSFDNNGYQSSEKDLSPEIQIRRLTAQLTAAYNRIAALEEQLLASRFR